MPGPRGRAPTSRARLTPSKIVAGVVADLDAGQGRERAVVELHDDALERLQRRLDLEQPQLDRAVRAEQRAAGEAEEQAVADLAGGAGDGDLQRGGAHVTPEPSSGSPRATERGRCAMLGHEVPCRWRWSPLLALAGCGSAAGATGSPRRRRRRARDPDADARSGRLRGPRRQPLPAAGARARRGPTRPTGGDVAETITVTVTDQTRVVAGVTTTSSTTRSSTPTARSSRTPTTGTPRTAAGNVWYFGEDTTAYDGDEISTEGSWEAGVDGAQAGRGDAGRAAGGRRLPAGVRPGDAEDRAEVLSIDDQVDVDAESYDDVVATVDTTPARARPRRAEVLRPRRRAGPRGDASRRHRARRADVVRGGLGSRVLRADLGAAVLVVGPGLP